MNLYEIAQNIQLLEESNNKDPPAPEPNRHLCKANYTKTYKRDYMHLYKMKYSSHFVSILPNFQLLLWYM